MSELLLPDKWQDLSFPENADYTQHGRIHQDDVAIAPLVYIIYQLGVPTRGCCGGHFTDYKKEIPYVIYRSDCNEASKFYEGLEDALRNGDFLWSAKPYQYSSRIKPMDRLTPDICDRGLSRSNPLDILLTRLESVNLAIHIIKYFGLEQHEKEALEMMERFKEEVKDMPL